MSEIKKKRKITKKKALKKGNVAHLFGANPKEIDGLKFQKKVRSEWD